MTPFAAFACFMTTRAGDFENKKIKSYNERSSHLNSYSNSRHSVYSVMGSILIAYSLMNIERARCFLGGMNFLICKNNPDFDIKTAKTRENFKQHVKIFS